MEVLVSWNTSRLEVWHSKCPKTTENLYQSGNPAVRTLQEPLPAILREDAQAGFQLSCSQHSPSAKAPPVLSPLLPVSHFLLLYFHMNSYHVGINSGQVNSCQAQIPSRMGEKRISPHKFHPRSWNYLGSRGRVGQARAFQAKFFCPTAPCTALQGSRLVRKHLPSPR